MTTDRNTPAENPDHASQEPPAEERVAPGAFAHQLFEHLVEVQGDANANLYLAKAVREVMERAPATKDAIVADLLTELKEEIARREDPRYSRATVALIDAIEDDWRKRG